MRQMTRVQIIRAFFFGPEAKASEVLKEMKALTEDDKQELLEGILKLPEFTDVEVVEKVS